MSTTVRSFMPVQDWAELLLLTSLGAVEGSLTYLAGPAYPMALRSQMLFQSFTIMKMYLSSLGASLVAQGIFSRWCSSKFECTRQYRCSDNGVLRICLGGFLLGCGMTICGSGPTLMPTQLGAGVPGTLNVLGGALCGTALFEAVKKYVPFMKLSFEELCPLTTVDAKDTKRYAQMALLSGLTLLAGAGVLEAIFPHSRDTRQLGVTALVNPIVVGLVVGCTQIPMRLISGAGHGATYAFSVIVSTLTRGCVGSKDMVLSLSGPNWNWHQLSFVFFGLALGAHMARRQVGYIYPTSPSHQISPLLQWFGGLVGLFGAKLAGGCACGRGVTGVSELSLLSICATASIFGGAIGTALVFFQ